MKNLFLLFAMAVLLCTGMAVLCTACTEEPDLPADAALSGMETSESVRNTVPSPPPTAIPEIRKGSKNLDEPDMQGIIQDVGQSSFTILPIQVQAAGDAAMASAGESAQDTLTVTFRDTAIETVRVYNGGHDEVQSASTAALVNGRQVYLYGQPTETGFNADRVLVLQTEADVS